MLDLLLGQPSMKLVVAAIFAGLGDSSATKVVGVVADDVPANGQFMFTVCALLGKVLPEGIRRRSLQVDGQELSEHDSALEDQRRDERVLHVDQTEGCEDARRNGPSPRGWMQRVNEGHLLSYVRSVVLFSPAKSNDKKLEWASLSAEACGHGKNSSFKQLPSSCPANYQSLSRPA